MYTLVVRRFVRLIYYCDGCGRSRLRRWLGSLLAYYLLLTYDVCSAQESQPSPPDSLDAKRNGLALAGEGAR